MQLDGTLCVLLAVLVAVEVAVVVPVIITQRNADEAAASEQLQQVACDVANRMNVTVNTLLHNVLRTAAAVPETGFFSRKSLLRSLQLDTDPHNTPTLLYAWVPLVADTDRAAFERFYGFPITQLVSSTAVGPVPNNTGRTRFAPFSLFETDMPQSSLSSILGFDLLSVPLTAHLLKNARNGYLVLPSPLFVTTPRNFGVVAVAYNEINPSWFFGRAGTRDLLEFSLPIPRRLVTLAAYVPDGPPEAQLLFRDDADILANASTIAAFEALPGRSQFYACNVTVQGQVMMIAARFDRAYVAASTGVTWVILAAVLGPVCFLINVIALVLGVLWRRRAELYRLEEEKRKSAQLMLVYVNHGENRFGI